MPKAKASNKKGQTKKAAAADANSVQNLEVEEKLTKDNSALTTLTNGSTTEEDLQEKVIVAKRSSGRAKKEEKVVIEVNEEKKEPKKKPAAKAKAKAAKETPQVEMAEEQPIEEAKAIEKKSKTTGGRKKKQETKLEELIEDVVPEKPQLVAEKETPQVEITKEQAKVIEKKSKTTGGRKNKQETKTEDIIEENDKVPEPTLVAEKETTQVESAKEQPKEESKASEKKTKTKGGRQKKQETKAEEIIEENDKAPEPPLVEAKKSSRSTKKLPETVEQSKEEPPKKKSRSSKKETVVETVESVDTEIQVEAAEKKPTKRGRAALSKAAAKTDDFQESAGTEEVLPKKRSRKAPSVEKEIVEEKPKKGRGKKAEKPIEVAQIEEKEEIETNGQDKLENIQEIEETKTSNKKAEKKPTTARGGRKRAAPSTSEQKTAEDDVKLDNVEDLDDNDEADASKPKKSKKKTDSVPLNATTTKYNKSDFDLAPLPEGHTAKDSRFNLKISSWNVAGLRSWLKKEGLKYLEYEQPDIFCMQEIKCTTDQLPDEVQRIPGYHPYWLCMPGGYAGVAIYSKIMPIHVEYGIGHKEFDETGRIITAEYEKFFLVNVYVPNSGRKLVNLESRMKWEKLFQEFIQNLNARKPVVICGDMNVSHQEHDLANPKTNTRNAGFTKEERDKMSELLSLGYVDTFRHLYPERKGAYTFWTYMGNARSRNVGWRLDYFIVSERFIKRVVDNCIRSQCMGSDHCPITLFLKL